LLRGFYALGFRTAVADFQIDILEVVEISGREGGKSLVASDVHGLLDD